MNHMCEGAMSVLENVYSAEHASFPFTIRLEGGKYRPISPDRDSTIRSTVNCLLGLSRAVSRAPATALGADVGALTGRFLEVHEEAVRNIGDLGLLMAVLSEIEDGVSTRRILRRLVDRTSDDANLRMLNVQDLCWLMWGAVSAYEKGFAEAPQLADRCFTALVTVFLEPGHALPRHTSRGMRGDIVSFGSSVYFLQAIYLYWRQFASSRALELFRRGVSAVVAAQGPNGEWPWLLNTGDARPLELYPVFSVHQHSMAMLFLLPAMEIGLDGVEQAMARSVSWITGANQLGVSMLQEDPFFVYRSLERRDAVPRAQRYLRARWALSSGRTGHLEPNGKLRVNTECRPYEMAWILYTLSALPNVPGID